MAAPLDITVALPEVMVELRLLARSLPPMAAVAARRGVLLAAPIMLAMAALAAPVVVEPGPKALAEQCLAAPAVLAAMVGAVEEDYQTLLPLATAGMAQPPQEERVLVALDPVAAALAADMAAKAETAGNPTSAAAAVEAATEPMATAVAAGIAPPRRIGVAMAAQLLVEAEAAAQAATVAPAARAETALP